VAFSSTVNPGDGGTATVDLRSLDGTATRPDYATGAAMGLLARTSQQAPAFSKSHWSDTEKIALSMYDDYSGKHEIAWTNLATMSTEPGIGWGILARQGDAQHAAAAAFSHDGTRVVYTSCDGLNSGVNAGPGANVDLWSVPWNGGAGGTATPVAGAAEPGVSEHYAAFSADDSLLAFIRVPASEETHDRANAEVWVVPAAGGTAVRLDANAPAACTGRVSPGLTNSWPKWSPATASSGTTIYHWLTFSSRRADGTPQLYVTAVTTDELGAIHTYPAIYLWNQPADESNHTPAWDNFDIIIQ
jgi:hypothetical protein